MLAIAIIGAGPRGICVLERIRANAPEILPHGRLQIHMIDPFPFGAGRLWRQEQSPLMLMNSRANLVTVFTDEFVDMAGPVWPGLNLVEWVAAVRDGGIVVDVADDVRAEINALADRDFVPRRVHGAYLSWAYRHIVDELPPEITVMEHSTKAVDVADVTSSAECGAGSAMDAIGGKQRVWLADGSAPLVVDAVVMTNGHVDGTPTPSEAPWRDLAEQHGLRHFPPAYTADVDFSAIQPGEKVLVRGLGMAFTDLVTLLTQGRGGRFVETDSGLRYVPSGKEPVLYAGSRRGLPYHVKASYQLASQPQLPRFFTEKVIEDLIAPGNRLNFLKDVWPHVAKEIAWGYYSELWRSHHDRLAVDFIYFTEKFSNFRWNSAEMRDLITKSVPLEEDRLDLEKINQPMLELSFPSVDDTDKHIRGYIEKDLARRSNSRFSADVGAILGLFSVFDRMPLLVSSGLLDAVSISSIVDGWWFNLFSHIANGPPPQRVEELHALHTAGLVTFLGANMEVDLDREQRLFSATSSAHTEKIYAKTLVDARIPSVSVAHCDDQMMRRLFDAGELTEESAVDEVTGKTLSSGRILIDAKGHVIGHNGKSHPRRFALGPNTSSRIVNSFTVPGVNPPCFRQNDVVARELLTVLASVK